MTAISEAAVVFDPVKLVEPGKVLASVGTGTEAERKAQALALYRKFGATLDDEASPMKWRVRWPIDERRPTVYLSRDLFDHVTQAAEAP